MGFLGKLLGGTGSKTGFIRSLVKQRISSDSAAQSAGFTLDMVDSLSGMQIRSLPEAGILSNVETYLKMKKLGATDLDVFQRIEAHRSRMVSGTMPDGCDLRRYIKYRVHLENSQGAPISNESIDSSINQAIEFLRK